MKTFKQFCGFILGATLGVVFCTILNISYQGMFSPEAGSKAWMEANKCVLTNEYDHVLVERKKAEPEWKPIAPYVQRQYDCEKGVMFARVLGGYSK